MGCLLRFGRLFFWRRCGESARSQGAGLAPTPRAERHGVDDFLAFLRLLAKTYPGPELHLVVDNYHTHKHLEVEQWLEHHKRAHLHFTFTSASWMNQVEIWFSLLHRGAIQRGVFKSVAALRQAIQRFLDA